MNKNGTAKRANVQTKSTAATATRATIDEIPIPSDISSAKEILATLAGIFNFRGDPKAAARRATVTDVYRTLVEQIPAIVFIAFFDNSFGEAYVSPQIEETLGYTQEEWLNDPIRWYERIHPDDKERWSGEVAAMLRTGEPLHSTYRIFSRDRRVISFQCDVKIVRHTDGRPLFIHGTASDITRRQENEKALRDYADRMEHLSRRLIDVQESERRTIALELHDQIGQILTGLKLKMEMLARETGDASRSGFDEAQSLVNELITRTCDLSLDLRPATLDHLGLLAAMLRHLRHYTSLTNIVVEFRHDGLEGRRFSPDLETAAFRIVQEALTNIARHSGSDVATVHIWANDKQLSITVEDKGCGFDAGGSSAVGAIQRLLRNARACRAFGRRSRS